MLMDGRRGWSQLVSTHPWRVLMIGTHSDLSRVKGLKSLRAKGGCEGRTSVWLTPKITLDHPGAGRGCLTGPRRQNRDIAPDELLAQRRNQ